MSRIDENGYRIEYPNVLAYAGQPMLVRVTNANGYAGVGVSIKVGEEYYTETRELYDGSTTFDISRYAQMAFVGKSLGYRLGYNNATRVRKSALSQGVEVVVNMTKEDGASSNVLSFSTTALYGYLGVGQSNGGYRTRRWFVNYPQSFDIYNDPANGLDVYLDGESLSVANYDNLTQAYIDLSRLNAEGKVVELAAHSEASFLIGNEYVESPTFYKLLVDRRTSGIYLRWLDHFGHWCYYLFRVTGRSYTAKEVRSWSDGMLRDDLVAENAVFVGSGQKYQQLSEQESISLGAKLVDAEEFSFLLSIINAPIVEVLVNAEEYRENNAEPMWERVSVTGGSYARTNAPLQDFVVSIARNAHNSQML